MILNSPTISGSLTVTGNILTSGSITLSGSIASASYALSASNAQTASFANAFTVAGNLTAQTLVVQTITSSIDFVTGSTRFGSLLSNTHVFSGSVTMNPGGLFVSGSGLVGIGTTSPKESFEIAGLNGNIRLYGRSGISQNQISSNVYYNGSAWVRDNGSFGAVAINLNPSGILAFYTTSSTSGFPDERMRITEGGNVGIGTSTPQGTLEVVGLSYFTRSSQTTLLNPNYGGANTHAQLQVVGNMALAFATNGDNERMRITSGGNVGIGTTSPQSIFHIGAPAPANSGVKAYTGLANSYEGFLFDYYYNTAASNLRVFDIVALGASTTGIGGSDIRFLTVPQTTTGTPIERLRITNNGNIIAGYNQTTSNTIGRTFATSHASGNRGATLFYGITDGGNGGMLIYNVASSIAGHNSQYISFETHEGGVSTGERMRITSGGVVNIGSTSGINLGERFNVIAYSLSSPTLSRFFVNVSGALSTSAARFDKFDNNSTTSQVFIDFTINNQNTANGSITANGANQATFTSWSDRRLKENITNLPSQLSNIMALRPVEFDYKDGSGHQIGFIAQEVQEVYSDIVGENAEGYLTISGLGKMESRLIKAIQELKAQNDDLQSQINELKAQ